MGALTKARAGQLAAYSEPSSDRRSGDIGRGLLENHFVQIIAYLSIWCSFGFANVLQTYQMRQIYGRQFDLESALVLGMSDWTIWALLGPLIMRLCVRFPLDRRWMRHLPVHAVACCACVLVVSLAVIYVTSHYDFYPFLQRASLWQRLRYSLVVEGVFYVWVYCGIVGACSAIVNYRRFREREERSLILESRLSEARLLVPQSQLQPHFLFNTLNSIVTLMHQDLAAAESMLTRLASLLRDTLDAFGRQEVTLREEMELLDAYVEIQRVRFGDRLRVIRLVDPETLDLFVPSMILQPLVENAFEHGLGQLTGAAELTISAQIVDKTLEMEIRDNGPGLVANKVSGENSGIGLSNSKERLRQLFGASYQLAMENTPTGGMAVTVRHPLRYEPVLAADTAMSASGSGTFAAAYRGVRSVGTTSNSINRRR